MRSLIDAALKLRNDMSVLDFSEPVAAVYNPLYYAWEPYKIFVNKYGNGDKKVLFLGMNPGPWGMAQTGIPFGEISFARDWLEVAADVSKPKIEHPKRPIQGFSCERSEVSGRRLWSLFSSRFGTADNFFQDHFVSNYCPLVFMEESGRNRTPDKLPAEERIRLFEACDRHLESTILALRPRWLIGIGGFAGKRFEALVKRRKDLFSDLNLQLGRILHPSPASPAANKGWAEAAEKQLSNLGVW
jgi:single-strand selective monofunctional uracil DNA glycosylase